MMEDSAYLKRLKERLRRKPDSKLSLSFAEELRRRDMIDEAIAALLEGIKKNHGFITAHLALGRWYLSSDMLPEAKKEFLEAAEKSPDNLFARKGLAEVYKRMGVEPPEEAEVSEFPATVATDSKKDVVDRLNLFLEMVKGRFAVSRKDAVKDRLGRMLKAINIRFAAPPPAAPSYKD